MPDASSPRKPRILIVDDFATIRRIVIDFLGDDYDCSQATNGQEALLHVKDAAPDLIVSDLAMPVMDGIELLRTLRAHDDPAISKIPVIVLSTNPDRDRALELGANATAPKALSAAEFRAIVDRVLRDDKSALR